MRFTLISQAFGACIRVRCYLPSSLFDAFQAKRGGLANTDAIDLLAAVLKGVISQTHIDPKVIPSDRKDACMQGCVEEMEFAQIDRIIVKEVPVKYQAFHDIIKWEGGKSSPQ